MKDLFSTRHHPHLLTSCVQGYTYSEEHSASTSFRNERFKWKVSALRRCIGLSHCVWVCVFVCAAFSLTWQKLTLLNLGLRRKGRIMNRKTQSWTCLFLFFALVNIKFHDLTDDFLRDSKHKFTFTNMFSISLFFF